MMSLPKNQDHGEKNGGGGCRRTCGQASSKLVWTSINDKVAGAPSRANFTANIKLVPVWKIEW